MIIVVGNVKVIGGIVGFVLMGIEIRVMGVSVKMGIMMMGRTLYV